ncbi:hypothetical protein RFI_16598 [Reticulomyxa filosa]|uniref:Aminoacyl-tRNA synthetase class II (D/K/N) domain-containing protein n=1 Tax=Reticulomyxa filosa TaxID=46433 RepID=X6N2W8_RETFI|nr:hypothetical protein RFI_16598 [Reticulomyxa filosa]|eukprot:ETO20620.1 hypothetical protein RFI_16598 [Reticulomyxa filosa]
MTLTEELLSGMVLAIKGSYKIPYTFLHSEDAGHGGSDEDDSKKEAETKKGETVIVDFTPPWPRYNMIDTLEERGKFKIPRPLDSVECNELLSKKCEELNVECGDPRTTARLLDKLTDHFIESTLVSPAFITCHPVLMSPLAKYHRSRPELTERFELFCCRKELCNAYTELNNPKVQRERFLQQIKEKYEKGDSEAMEYDKDFCEAMEYGLPPTVLFFFIIPYTIICLH